MLARSNDLAEALAYLQQEAPEQVPRLNVRYREICQLIRSRPLLYAPLVDDYRRAVLVPFRLMIIYTTDGRSTEILAVFHFRRDDQRLTVELAERTFE